MLRERKGYTYGFHSRLVGVVDHSPAVVTGAVETSVTGAALSDIEDILGAVAQEDLTEYEHRAALAQIVDAAPLRHLVPADVAEEIALLVLDRRDPAVLTEVFPPGSDGHGRGSLRRTALRVSAVPCGNRGCR